MKKVIVTGALGFIGHHLCTRLLEDGVEVVGIDNIQDSPNRALYEYKYDLIGRNSLFHFLDSKMETINFPSLVNNVDVVFHLGAATRQENSWRDLEEIIAQNVKVTKDIAIACTKGPRLIFASTVLVYGERTGKIMENSPKNPITPYGLTKMTAESILHEQFKKNKLQFVTLRLPIVYGPWQREDMTYHQLLKAKILKQHPVYKKDRTTLDVIYISDVIDGFILAATKSNVDNQAFNIVSGKKHEWFRGIDIILHSKIEKPNNPLLEVSVSNEKAKKLLGFNPKVTLEEGLKLQEKQMNTWHGLSDLQQ